MCTALAASGDCPAGAARCLQCGGCWGSSSGFCRGLDNGVCYGYYEGLELCPAGTASCSVVPAPALPPAPLAASVFTVALTGVAAGAFGSAAASAFSAAVAAAAPPGARVAVVAVYGETVDAGGARRRALGALALLDVQFTVASGAPPADVQAGVAAAVGSGALGDAVAVETGGAVLAYMRRVATVQPAPPPAPPPPAPLRIPTAVLAGVSAAAVGLTFLAACAIARRIRLVRHRVAPAAGGGPLCIMVDARLVSALSDVPAVSPRAAAPT